jgi:6-phosphogluconate dehydrogenase
MIRLTLGHYLAEMRDRCDADNGQDHAQHDMLTEGSSIITLMLLLPLSWMAELESIAAPGDTTEGILIRRVVYSALIGCQAGEGRWIVKAAIDESVPAPVLTAARYERFASRGDADFADNLLSVLRFQFGGHEERPEGAEGGGR